MSKRCARLTRILGVSLTLILFFVIPDLARADWTDISDQVTASIGRPKSSKKNQVWISEFYVANTSAEPIQGPLRVVITSSTAPLSTTYGAPDGTTADGKPYYDIVTDPAYILNPGARSPTVEICFELTRKRPSYTVRVELDRQAPPPGPVLSVEPTSLDFGAVLVGGTDTQSFTVGNTGDEDLQVTDILVGGYGFHLYPPLSLTIPPGGPRQSVSVGFSPDAAGSYTGSVTVLSNGGTSDVVLSGTGEPSLEPGDIQAVTALDFGMVFEGDTVERMLTVGNEGAGLLTIWGAETDDPAFSVEPAPGNILPFTLLPDEHRAFRVALTPPLGAGGNTLTGRLSIASDDPDQNPFSVALQGDVVGLRNAEPEDLPVLSARVRNPDDQITAASCANVTGEVLLTAAVETNDSFTLTLVDGTGAGVTSAPELAPLGGGLASFGPVHACGLSDGVVALKLSYQRGGQPLGTFTGRPAVKSTSSLPAPVLDPLSPVTLHSLIQVCGSSRQQTTVTIAGGASPVTTSLGLGQTRFCLDVPLRRNTENTLVASAVDDVAPIPRPTAWAPPVQVVHLDPSEVVIASVDSRPLTTAEIEALVASGVVDLDDPENYHFSMFTVVLYIGGTPITLTEPVVIDLTSGGWIPVGETGLTGGRPRVWPVRLPDGAVIPAVIIIDGTIKTLKELFQVTIALLNTSQGFQLTDVAAQIRLPAGLTAISSGVGDAVSEVPPPSEVEDVAVVRIGSIAPGETGMGQFVVRGDAIGTHEVDVGYAGFITEGGLPYPVPFHGSGSTSLQVYGPPELDVVVRHPSRVDAADVIAGEIYDLIVEITNQSASPALYASLELFVGGGARLVDANDQPIPGSTETLSLGHLQPGQTVSAAFRVEALVTGEIIACRAVASDNITLTVDTGPDGVGCAVAGTSPAPYEPLPVDLPPTVRELRPPCGQTDLPLDTGAGVTLQPWVLGLVGDQFQNLVYEERVDELGLPYLLITGWDLQSWGTYYLEELDPYGRPVTHLPVELSIELPPAGTTTIADLELGLDDLLPGSRLYLRSGTTYRSTLVGGPSGISSAGTGLLLPNSVRCTFSTAWVCQETDPPLVTLVQPLDGSVDRPLNQRIVLDFTNRMDPESFAFVPGDLAASSFGVYQDATVRGGVLIDEGRVVEGNGVFSNANRRLTFTPAAPLGEDAAIFVRLTRGLVDLCGNPLVTPAKGELLFSFRTQPPDNTPPEAPAVNPIPALTKEASIQVSGSAEASSLVTVCGGASLATVTASDSGLFTLPVTLRRDETNSLQAQAEDASGNLSPPTTVDIQGQALVVTQDSIPPALAALVPPNGASGVPQDVVVQVGFNEPIDPVSVNANNFELVGTSPLPGALALDGTGRGFTFTPSQPLEDNRLYSLRLRAGGIKDQAGNGLATEIRASFSTGTLLPPVLEGLVPNQGTQGETLMVTFTGQHLASASAVTSANPGISGSVLGAGDTLVTASVGIAPTAPAGETTLGLVTAGGSATLPFTVLPRPPVVTALVPDSGYQGQSVDAQIQGSGLTDASLAIDGSGVALSVLGGTDTVINLRLVIEPLAAPGERGISVTTAGGTATTPFTVLAVPTPPVLSGVAPAGAEPGQTLPVTLTGAYLYSVYAVTSPNPGVSATILGASADGSSLNLSVAVAADAERGPTSLVAQGAGGSAGIGFVVDDPPVLTAVVPAQGYLGQTLNLTFTGTALVSAQAILSSNPGISGSVLSATDTAVEALISIAPVAPQGPTQLGVRTAIGEASIAFTVALPPSPAEELLEAISRAVSVYQGPLDGEDPAADLRQAVSRAVSVYQGPVDGEDPAADLRHAVSRAVSVYQGPLDGEDAAADLRDSVSRAVSVRQAPEE